MGSGRSWALPSPGFRSRRFRSRPGLVWCSRPGWCCLVCSAGLRACTEVRVDEDGIETRPGRGRLRWSNLQAVKLRYFAVRRERERVRGQGGRRGWMQFVLKGDGKTVRIDSRLDGFDEVLRRSAAAAASLRLDPVTQSNFEAAGIAVAQDGAEEAPGPRTPTGRAHDA